jgi:hypothetical protein
MTDEQIGYAAFVVIGAFCACTVAGLVYRWDAVLTALGL